MDKQEVIVMEKKSTVWTVIKVILVLAIIAFVAYKIYQKIAKKKKEAALEAEEASLLDFAENFICGSYTVDTPKMKITVADIHSTAVTFQI